MVFDPDAYLSSKKGGFDPDAYLNSKKPVQSEPAPAFNIADQAARFLPMPSKLGMKAMNVIQRGADKAGEIAAEDLASGITPKVNPMLPFPLNVSMERTPGKGLRASPEIAAGIGTLIQMSPDIISAGAPLAEAGQVAKVAERTAEAAPNLLQRLGAQGLNKSVGIQPRTLMKMAGKENPAAVGTELGRTLFKEGATGLSPGRTFEKASSVKEQFGKDVGSALEEIRNAGTDIGTSAKKALQPILDKWAELGDATLSQNRVMAKPYAEVFSKLEKVANEKGGMLGIDDIQNQMEEVGKLFNKTPKTSDKYGPLAELYGTLADARDSIITDISERAGNPALGSKLLEANKGFTRYSRIMPDIAKEAAEEGAGVNSFSFGTPIKSVIEAIRPALSKGALAVGDMLSANPASLGKYGPALVAEASKGPENFELFHNSLLASEPTYLSLINAATKAPRSVFRKVASAEPSKLFKKSAKSKTIVGDGNVYTFNPGKNGNLTARKMDPAEPRPPLFADTKKRAKVIVGAVRG